MARPLPQRIIRPSMRRIPLFADRRFLALLALGFSAGVPLPLVAGAVLRQWFSEAGVPLAQIGLTALIGLAYSLKFLWAPALDAVAPPFARSGRRRGWMLVILPLLMGLIVLTGLGDPAAAPLQVAALAAAVAFLSASQDIVVDAWRVEMLADEEQGYGLACYVWGYRGALLASGAGTLLLVQHLGWAGAYIYAASLLLVGLGAALIAPEGPAPALVPLRIGLPVAVAVLVGVALLFAAVLQAAEAVLPDGAGAAGALLDMLPWLLALLAIGLAAWAAHRALLRWRPGRDTPFTGMIDSLGAFLRRPLAIWILLFIALFKLGEALAGVMTNPFYRALGFSREEVAAVGSVFGLLAILGGALAGGWLVSRIGTGKALVITGLGQMLSNLMYVALAHAGHDVPMLWAQVGIENFTDGLADAAFVTYLSGLTMRAYTATQYALLSSLAAVPLRTLGASSGWLAERMGWADFFLLTTAAALPAMIIMAFLLWRLPPARAEQPA
ncbi:AmpG family muropeptide MFS transporter [Muricoccus radiodurans]|uniref:AmpG family muropeptide MFS transporter n=1 Tax=Muricoccus radiodurans TaxID=2231721 RepID=UPI003CE943DF